MDGRNDVNLVLEGGGVKGIGLVGAAVALADAQYSFARIAGTSAGAVVGSLLAACEASGSPVSGVVEVMQALDYSRFQDRTVLDRLHMPGEVAELLVSGGVFTGDYLVKWLGEQLADKGVHTFGDLRCPGVAADAPIEQRYRLVVVAADISQHQLVQLPWDYPKYGLDPDEQLVVDAVRASMSIPFFFQPAILKGKGASGSSTLVDGGLLWNFPIDIFDQVDAPAVPAVPTVGVKLSARTVAAKASRPAGFGPLGITVDAIETLLAEHDRYHLDAVGATANTIFVDTFDVSAVDFDIDRPTQDRLYASGRTAAKSFLEHWPPSTPS